VVLVVIWLGLSIATGREFLRRVAAHDRRSRDRAAQAAAA
jgi:hypothetical protein